MKEIIKLENGLTVILEKSENIASASVGVFMDCGTRCEKQGEEGISHFIEHMVFKGTDMMSSKELSYAFDMLGGSANAYTSKECTVFYAKVLDCHVGEALTLILDMLLNSAMRESDIETEKNVVIEEINMYEDSPEELVVDNLLLGIYGDSGLGSNILGTKESMTAMTPEKIRHYMSENYVPKNTIISINGHFDKALVMSVIQNFYEPISSNPPRPLVPTPEYKQCLVKKSKDFEQNHLCFAFPAYRSGDARNRSLSVLSGILGDGMSSRLFQRLREDNGLVYAVSSFMAPHKDSGLFCIYCAQQADTEKQVYDIIMEEIDRLCKEGVTDEELLRGKVMLKTGTVLGFESSYHRMSFNAHDYLIRGRIRELAEISAEIDAVTAQTVMDAARDVLNVAQMSFSVVGRVD